MNELIAIQKIAGWEEIPIHHAEIHQLILLKAKRYVYANRPGTINHPIREVPTYGTLGLCAFLFNAELQGS